LSILTAEYDFDTAMAVKQEEAYEEGLHTGREEGISIGLERGAYQTKLETARNLLQDGFSAEMIAKYTCLPEETIHQLLQSR
jgi:predicted transposase/invertase (TIGR01784 family)